jgi:hypothetical protein
MTATMKTRDITLSSLFGLLIFLQKFLLPAPYDKTVTVFLQIALLSLAFLIMGFVGPILTSVTSGLLTAVIRSELAPLTFTFAVLYGILVSSFNQLLNVADSDRINRTRFLASSTASTLLVGILSSTVSIVLGVLPYNFVLIVIIIASGAIQGVIGGYLSCVLWEKYFHRF